MPPRAKPEKARAFQRELDDALSRRHMQTGQRVKIAEAMRALDVSKTMFYRYRHGLEAPGDDVIANAERNLGLVWVPPQPHLIEVLREEPFRLRFGQPLVTTTETTIVI